MMRITIFFLVFIYTCNFAHAKTHLPLNDYFSETWNTRSGLPHNSINSIAQTADGYLWFATWEGLARFNGREFKLFTRADIPELPDTGLRDLLSQPDGSLYIGGDRGGISHFVNGQWHTKPNAKKMVNGLLKVDSGGLWLALEDGGVVFRNQTLGVDINVLTNLSAYELIKDRNGVIWAATSKGLYKIEGKKVHLITPAEGLPDGAIYTLLLTRKGQLIVGGEKGAWQLVKDSFLSVNSELDGQSVSSLLEDNHEDLWFGTINKGLFRLSSFGFEHLHSEAGLPGNRILSLLQDRENSIWVGTNSGLHRLREAPFASWTKKRGLSGNYIRTVLSATDGSIWVGGSKGLDRITGDTVENFIPKNNKSLSVLSLAEDAKGNIWFGTYTSGLLRVKNGEVQPVLNRHSGLASNEIRALLFDKQQRLWIGTASGVTRLETDGTLTQFTSKDGLPGDFILSLVQDTHGDIWVGTGVGIAKFNNVLDVFKKQSFPVSFNAKYAFGFLVQNNYLWMTTDRGLIRLNCETSDMRIVGLDEGLPVDKLFQIVAQGDAFWLSSNRGIIHVKQQQINDFMDDPALTKHAVLEYQIYDEGDGMLSAQANGGSTPAATLAHDGSLWFATANGVATVMPERLKKVSERKLPTVIESLLADGKRTSMKNLQQGVVILPPGSDRVSLHYAGLSFIMPQRLKFQTKLLGYNNKWVDRHQMNITEYTNLAPGEYTFMVRASYPNGQWQDNYQTLKFIIQPYFWQKLYFKLMLIILFIALFYGLYKYRLYYYQNIEKELKLRVEQQTHDLQAQTAAFAHQASHDQLTGLPNRRAFDICLGEHFHNAKQLEQLFSVVIIDIDHFKRINDNWSHMVGDRVICVIAHILQQSCEGNKNQVSRWGGEEFTLLLPNKTAYQAVATCEQLRLDILNYDFSTIAFGLNVTASLGIADSTSVQKYDRLLASADKALYQAKNNGRNRVEIFEPQYQPYKEDY